MLTLQPLSLLSSYSALASSVNPPGTPIEYTIQFTKYPSKMGIWVRVDDLVHLLNIKQ